MDQKTNSKSVAKDFFLYLFTFGLLYYSTIALITLLWQYVNYFFPGANNFDYYYDGLSGPMRFAVASLIILVPIYLIVSKWLTKDLDRYPEKKDLWVRRWLIYITLFVTAITIVVDLVTILNQFLSGDLVIQFGLKALSVFIVAAAVFMAMFLTLKREPGQQSRARSTIVWALVAIIIAAVIGAFFIIGTPSTSRSKKYDQTRIYDLQRIQSEVLNYYQQKEVLPASLGDLTNSLSNYDLPIDPENGENYIYEIVNAESLEFQLCATFVFPTIDADIEGGVVKPREVDYYGGVSQNWSHQAGYQCFSRIIDPDIYPTIKDSRVQPISF